VIMESDSPWTT